MTELSSRRLVALLVQKDWQLVRGALAGYGLIGIASLIMLSLDANLLFIAGSILLLTTVAVVGAHLVIVTVLREREQQTLAFVMSLPVTYIQYTIAKLAANLGAFAIAWLSAVGAVGFAVLMFERLPDGLLPYALIVLLELFVTFLLTLSAAMITGSEAWTIAVMTIGNISISIFMFSIAQIPEMSEYMNGPRPVWNATALSIIAAEVVIAAAIVAMTVWLQTKRRDVV